QMLDVVRWLTANLELREAFRRLQLRDTSGVLRTLPAARRQGAASSLQRLMAYGDSGLRVVEALINQASLSGGHRDRSDGRDRPRSVDGLPLVSHAAAWSSPDLITQLRTNRLSLEEDRQLMAAQAASMQRAALDQP